MTIEIPESAAEVEARAKADVQRELAESNPFLKNSWLGAIVTASAYRIYDFYLQLLAALKQSLPDTATGNYLIRWAAIWGKTRLAASSSSGRAVATGTATSVIPLGATLSVSGVGNFITKSASVISDQTVNIDDLTRSGSTATAVLPSDHGLANGVSVTIAGASASEFNITAVITVTAADEFQYQVVGTPADEIGTSATASFTIAGVDIDSVDFGASQNLDAGTNLSLQSPIVGVDDTMVVDFGAIGGGTDQESTEALRGRMLDKIQNPVAHFNVAAITEKAKEIAGVTRVFVQEITPAIGQVTIYFMRDNDDDPIPSGSEITSVKDNILTINPANTSDNDVIVLAPTAVPTGFTFSSLTPNTSTMQTAINANLAQFFDERTDVGVNVDEDAYRAAVFNTVDTVTGDVVQTFSLSSPSGDIAIAAGEIGTLGSVTYP